MAMTNRSLKAWAWTHKWSSLVSTLFMLLLCLTGLALIFHHEIGHLLGTEAEAPAMREATPMANLDDVLRVAQARHPERHPQFLFRDPDEKNVWFASFGATPNATENIKSVAVDARTAKVLAEPDFESGFIYIMFKLHVDLFADLPGKLFLGFMGLLLVIAIVSGVVLYAPFMRRLDFGTVRRERSTRVKWLDLHNLLGIVSLAWFFVVGATGIINTWADLVLKYWQFDQMTQMTAPYRGLPPPTQFGSLAAAVRTAEAREPDMEIGFVAFPGTLFSSPHHYAVFMRGVTPFTERLIKPVLLDAQTARFTDSRDMPWYVTALLVSQPLHFGDYGGMPMKILWAALDIITIIVLGSGLYLWWQRRKKPIDEMLVAAGAEGGAA